MRHILTATAAISLALGLSACASMKNDKMSMADNEACAAQSYAVFFDTGSDDFDESASGVLDNISTAYQGCDLAQLEILGYADSVGTTEANLELSDDRAEAVLAALEDRNVKATRVRIVPMGDRTAPKKGESNPFERRAVVRLNSDF